MAQPRWIWDEFIGLAEQGDVEINAEAELKEIFALLDGDCTGDISLRKLFEFLATNRPEEQTDEAIAQISELPLAPVPCCSCALLS